ncbi:methionine synthase II (cobalamin-independent) [Flavobacterium sp. 7E]|uniref:hypothetical protein n=1 Tax=Flavobacterium sp. 7E TaxID=2735898 RepID=UPI00156D798F|nr:hypothetical protein [Flavobacterium sp. 7E]NRS87184.1 methionine synthase II (cobalamin-independent) [Flavobacterium sp. 7E]
MYFDKSNDSIITSNDKKIFFCLSYLQKAKTDKLKEVIDFDLFDSKYFKILYGNDKKKILKELKRVEYGNVVYIEIVNMENNELELAINISNTNFKLFKKMQFKVVTMDSDWEIHYLLKEEKWVLTKIICNGF